MSFEEFQNLIKKYGFTGQVTEKQLQEVGLSEKLLKSQYLSDTSTRLSCYFNSELVMIEEDGLFNQNNNKILTHGQKHLTGLYRTYEVMIIAFLFCKFPDIYSRLEALWGLINPDQTDFVSREAIGTFLEKLQTICLIIPA